MNVSVDTLPVAGTAGIFTLHASKVMDVWQLLAESDEVWVVAHIDPPELAPTDGRALRWIRALADFAMEVPPPPCDS